MELWQKNGIPILHPKAPEETQKEAQTLADGILYEMLRQYVRTYVKIDYRREHEPQMTVAGIEGMGVRGFDNMTGLNEEQRKKIYKRFAVVPWKDQVGRPPIKDWRYLLLLGAQGNFSEAGAFARLPWKEFE